MYCVRVYDATLDVAKATTAEDDAAHDGEYTYKTAHDDGKSTSSLLATTDVHQASHRSLEVFRLFCLARSVPIDSTIYARHYIC
jgi:hypothetical protein